MPEDELLNKYEAQFRITILQKLDRIIGLLEQLSDSPPMTIILPSEDSDMDWDDLNEA